MDVRRIMRWNHYGTVILRLVLEWTILLVIATGIIAFYIRWAPDVRHPASMLAQIRGLLDDLFWLILLIEVRDLLNRLSVARLLDIIATVLARKLVLEVNPESAFVETGALVLAVGARLAWIRLVAGSPSPRTPEEDS